MQASARHRTSLVLLFILKFLLFFSAVVIPEFILSICQSPSDSHKSLISLTGNRLSVPLAVISVRSAVCFSHNNLCRQRNQEQIFRNRKKHFLCRGFDIPLSFKIFFSCAAVSDCRISHVPSPLSQLKFFSVPTARRLLLRQQQHSANPHRGPSGCALCNRIRQSSGLQVRHPPYRESRQASLPP